VPEDQVLLGFPGDTNGRLAFARSLFEAFFSLHAQTQSNSNDCVEIIAALTFEWIDLFLLVRTSDTWSASENHAEGDPIERDDGEGRPTARPTWQSMRLKEGSGLAAIAWSDLQYLERM